MSCVAIDKNLKHNGYVRVSTVIVWRDIRCLRVACPWLSFGLNGMASWSNAWRRSYHGSSRNLDDNPGNTIDVMGLLCLTPELLICVNLPSLSLHASVRMIRCLLQRFSIEYSRDIQFKSRIMKKGLDMVGLIKIGVFDVAFNKSIHLIHRTSC